MPCTSAINFAISMKPPNGLVSYKKLKNSLMIFVRHAQVNNGQNHEYECL
jgi:hypothetical protein